MSFRQKQLPWDVSDARNNDFDVAPLEGFDQEPDDQQTLFY